MTQLAVRDRVPAGALALPADPTATFELLPLPPLLAGAARSMQDGIARWRDDPDGEPVPDDVVEAAREHLRGLTALLAAPDPRVIERWFETLVAANLRNMPQDPHRLAAATTLIIETCAAREVCAGAWCYRTVLLFLSRHAFWPTPKDLADLLAGVSARLRIQHLQAAAVVARWNRENTPCGEPPDIAIPVARWNALLSDVRHAVAGPAAFPRQLAPEIPYAAQRPSAGLLPPAGLNDPDTVRASLAARLATLEHRIPSLDPRARAAAEKVADHFRQALEAMRRDQP